MLLLLLCHKQKPYLFFIWVESKAIAVFHLHVSLEVQLLLHVCLLSLHGLHIISDSHDDKT